MPTVPLYTDLGKKACTKFGEICSFSCLPVLPDPAGDLLSRICIPYFRALYVLGTVLFTKKDKLTLRVRHIGPQNGLFINLHL